jgi:thiamine biosynthesis lipoprotein
MVIVTLSACNPTPIGDDILFELIGEDEANYTLGASYVEKGFLAKDGSTNLADDVVINSTVNSDEAGDYTVTYSLNYKDKDYTLTRTVYYREEGCSVIADTNITQCDVNWSEYLHTLVKLRIYYEDDRYHNNVGNIFQSVENILSEYNNLSDKYATYEGYINVKTINDNPTTTHTIDYKLFDMIQFTIDHQEEVDNRFNLALGPVLSIWHDYRETCLTGGACEVPSLSALQAQNQYTDYQDIILDQENNTITMSENMSIDLGGMSKGYISNIIVEYLDALDLRGYLLNNGESNISIGGLHPTRENQKFVLAITDPTFQLPYYATVYLGDGDQLVTSGDYQQYYMVDDELYHHIINPVTLMPDRTSRSVSIVSSEAGLADMYSTAIFTMTVEQGQAFVNEIDGLEAIWYGLDGTIYFSENFEQDYLLDLNE